MCFLKKYRTFISRLVQDPKSTKKIKMQKEIFLDTWKWVFADGTDRQNEKQTDIVDSRLNRPKGCFRENWT